MLEKMLNMNDFELVSKVKTDPGGSSRYFEVLYKRYYSKVLDKCYSLVKNRTTAQEMTDDIFSKAFEKISSFKQLSSFSSWLYSITYNHCIDYLREKKKMHYPAWSRENDMPDIIDETEETIEEINYNNLELVFEMIHPEEKAILFMKYKDNLSMKQISAALRISENAAKMRIKRARSRVLYLYAEKFPME